MQYSDKPLRELKQAKDALASMDAAKTVSDLEALWKRFLHQLERTWNKAEAHYSRSPKWSGWHGKYAQARKKDELLVYLTKARDADEHGIEDISQKEMGSIGIGPAEPTGTFSLSVRVDEHGQIQVKEASGPVKIDVIPARVRLLPVTTRGRTYDVPENHLGKPINSSNLSELAQMALAFYEDFLAAADRFFITDARR